MYEEYATVLALALIGSKRSSKLKVRNVNALRNEIISFLGKKAHYNGTEVPSGDEKDVAIEIIEGINSKIPSPNALRDDDTFNSTLSGLTKYLIENRGHAQNNNDSRSCFQA